MNEMLRKTKAYSIVIFKKGPNRDKPGAEKVIWEHGRRNFALRAEGKLSIVCPITGTSEVKGLAIFNATTQETEKMMAVDPAVKAGVLTYEIHTCQSFPGDSLPK